MFAPRAGAVEAGFTGEGVPSRDVGAQIMHERGVAAGDVTGADDAHAFAFRRAVRETQVVAELLAANARSADAAGRVVVPCGVAGDDFVMCLRNAPQSAKSEGQPE